MGNSKAIWSKNILTRGKALIGKWGATDRATVKQAVHDGDTVNIELDGNVGIRFLGIDTPEISYQSPGRDTFLKIDPHFVDYLTDPFSDDYPESDRLVNDLTADLVEYLEDRLGPQCAINHYEHAKVAEDELERYIQRDVDSVGSNEEYRFFMAFSYEIMDRYGRLLCWLHQNLPRDQREGRISYNEEMLKSGMALPYFIFPNINPFRRKSIVESIPDPGDFKRNIEEDLSLSEARQFVREARNQNLGIFNPSNPLLLEPFELRYLARRGPPPRHVIDLRADDPVLLKPSKYYSIPPEDRLFINPEHVPLFKEKGYSIET